MNLKGRLSHIARQITKHSHLLNNSLFVGDPAAHDGEEVLRDGGVEVEAALQHVRVQQPRVRARLRLGQLLQLQSREILD